MSYDQVAARVLEALEACAAQKNLDIVSVEVGGPAARPTLRVRLDFLEGSPIDMQTIVDVTPWVSKVVEDLDPFSQSWELEVSSPGLDRPLRKERDFVRFATQSVELVSSVAQDGRTRFSGVLEGLEGGNVILSCDDVRVAIPLDEVSSCRIKPDFDAIFAQAKKANDRA